MARAKGEIVQYRPILDSVLGSLATLVAVWFWREILPRVLQRLYRHEPLIGGKWTTTFSEHGKHFHESVTIRQKGRRVNGEIVLHESDTETYTYRFEGWFTHLILTATYCSTDQADYESGAFALRYNARNRLVGQHILISRTSEQLISSPYEWTHV
jgi:hypothetical protein